MKEGGGGFIWGSVFPLATAYKTKARKVIKRFPHAIHAKVATLKTATNASVFGIGSLLCRDDAQLHQSLSHATSQITSPVDDSTPALSKTQGYIW